MSAGGTELNPVLILCLGNEIISDDRFGYEVALRLNAEGSFVAADVVYAPLAGFNLLDLLAGRDKALIVDTIKTDHAEPGSLYSFSAAKLIATHHLVGSHQISLPAALELGKLLGLEMPGTIDVVAVEAGDLENLSETMTPPVQQAVGAAVDLIRQWVLKNAIARA